MSPDTKNNQYIAITVDFCDGILTSRSSKNYDLVFEGCKLLHDEVRRAFKNEDICFTYFIRADNQIKYQFNRTSYLFDYYRDFWMEANQFGDEIGWHPHLYRLRGSVWLPQTDGAGVERQINSCYVELPMDVFFITSARVGEGRMTNYAINSLDKIGIKADSTALPGRVRNDNERSFNWSKTPTHPYNPSRFNYGALGLPGGRLNLLEIPFTMVETLAPYDLAPLKRYLDLTFEPSILGPGLKNAVKDSPFTVAVIHPSFILGGGAGNELISAGIDTVKQNIANVMAAVQVIGREPKFVRIRDIHEIYTGKFKP